VGWSLGRLGGILTGMAITTRHGGVRSRHAGRFVHGTLRLIGRVLLFVRDLVATDGRVIAGHLRLFIGLVALAVGLLSFTSDRYCDGNTSNYYACTRPSTYYYYPWWATALVVLGMVSITLWLLRTKRT
jgi:hypothetical protein